MTERKASALGYAASGHQVLPVSTHSKAPAIPKQQGGRGVLDATTDANIIGPWWDKYPRALVGLRPAEDVCVIDVEGPTGHKDNGLPVYAELVEKLGPLDGHPIAETPSGGLHIVGSHDLTPDQINIRPAPGIDIRTHSHYFVAPPAPGRAWREPLNGKPPKFPDSWQQWMCKQEPKPVTPKPKSKPYDGPPTIADYNAHTTWSDILTHWTLVNGDGESTGSRWRHPDATSPTSASITDGRLYIYSTNTDFEVTDAGRPRGYDKFDAYTILHHGGDFESALRSLKPKGATMLRAVREGEVARSSVIDAVTGTPEPKQPSDYFEKQTGLLAKQLADDVMRLITCGCGRADGRLYVYENGLWIPDDGRIQIAIATMLGDRYRKAHAGNVIDMIRFSPNIPRISCEPVPEYINVRNGMIHWLTGDLLPHSPVYSSTVQLPVDYDPKAKCPKFDQFLSEVLPPDCIDFIWELIGYTIYAGNPFHVAVLLYGSGRNGKGTLIRVLKALLGERNISSVTLYELVENRFRSSTLYGKLANLAGDLDGRWLDNTATFKALTGGDTIQGEIKHGAIFDFTPWALPFYSMNKSFASADSSEGWWARWVVVPFPNTFTGKENRGLDRELRTDAELSGILARAVATLPTLFARGRLLEPQSVRDTKRKFIAASDAVRNFVDEDCELDHDAWVERGMLYRAFARHASDNGARPMSNREFYNRIGQISGVREHRKTSGRGFQGVRLKGQP